MDAVTVLPAPTNEPVRSYAPGSPERAETQAQLAELCSQVRDLPHVIGGKQVSGSGEPAAVVSPHRHAHRLGTLRNATKEDAKAAVEAAARAAPQWRELSFDDRAAVFLKAADLLSGPWRARLVAATMLGQSKSVYQAEIDAACELVDFWRFNAAFARELLAEQPVSPPGVWNRVEYRPLEGFVYAITPFNFTAIGGNLPTAPALLGNTVIWKPSPSQALAAQLTLELLTEAGLPPGVINMLHGDGIAVSDVLLADPGLAGIHFTGSTATFQKLWAQVGANIAKYRGYPRIVGETGGKDFVLAHPSADPAALVTGLVRGAFDYQGQKCSAASRAYIPQSLWARVGEELAATANELRYGDVADFANFGGAVIDRRAFDKHAAALDRARRAPGVRVLAGGVADCGEGYFVSPTVLLVEDPADEAMRTEYFGPILSVHIYPDAAWEDTLRLVDATSKYALTGAVFAQDRAALAQACQALRFAAGNFYVNDKPTGAVVGQQPFGGGRASGTNDKAGSKLNLSRWASPRSIKETFVPAVSHSYPHMGQ
ncbi:delta-1-pyrroline-5-carboxylate dehydrogenase [Segniliparus rotundus DSM 44985]|uniref:L-glutamate gamma-semialdehyde dehydrogenase n=1 Tax=Segniliparus rotundus (strain ATCC BAA-972 / CDC 1076 / CIP 108378 / DSM 44985 / JCM 13578) TaxID=640132 RepID=D6ZD39_SEGRD|nr:L-glutamate gamma-semialdehyde dehydrogenase [Segniliparus rotundus]ADG99226.1 delta-1-pyrroline-5-carboxylate dehydrogenase [Segniliparus rotundus DSM 44985]